MGSNNIEKIFISHEDINMIQEKFEMKAKLFQENRKLGVVNNNKNIQIMKNDNPVTITH